MSDPAYALQDAIHDALRGQTDAGDHVYDTVPLTNPFPRIVLGRQQTIGDFADCYDGSESFIQIDVYSIKTASLPEVKTIASQVRSLLHNADLNLVGHVLSLIEFQDADYSKDPDGKTGRARMTFHARTQAEYS